ncbi:unnamed protein product, partial [Mesorhabditis spiculigera]
MAATTFSPLMEEEEDSGFASLGCSQNAAGAPVDFSAFQLSPAKDHVMTDAADEMADLHIVSSKRPVIRRPFGDRTNSCEESPKGRFIPLNRSLSETMSSLFKNKRKRSQPQLSYDEEKRRRDFEPAQPGPSSQPVDQHSTTPGKRQTPQFRRALSFACIEGHHSIPVEDESTFTLPYIHTSDSTAFKRVTSETVAELILSHSPEEFHRKFILVDCRYPFEYNGGHLKNAINLFAEGAYDATRIPSKRLMEVFYPECPIQRKEMLARIPIFYCEFSTKRGPAMASSLRSIDRTMNQDSYPYVDYKEIYLLQDGFKAVWTKITKHGLTGEILEPHGYTAMAHPDYASELKKYKLHRHGNGAMMTAMRQLVQRPQSQLRLKDEAPKPITPAHRRLRPMRLDMTPGSENNSPRRLSSP